MRVGKEAFLEGGGLRGDLCARDFESIEMEFEEGEEGGSGSELQMICELFLSYFLTSTCLLPLVCLCVLICFLLIHCYSLSEKTVARSPKVKKTTVSLLVTPQKRTG